MSSQWYAAPMQCRPNGMSPHCNATPCLPIPSQFHAAPCHPSAMLPHVFPMACCPNGMSLPCHPNSMSPHAALIPCHPMLPHAAPIPCRPMPSKFHAATSPSAHPSILYHSLPLMLVLNPIHCPSAHPYTVCNQYSINPSPYIIHPPAHPSALGTAHTSAHPSAMATIYPMGPCGMAPSGT